MPRKKLMAANWKMYKNPSQTQAFFHDFLPLVAGHARDEIVVCPPYIDLYVAIEAVKGSSVASRGAGFALGKRRRLYRRDLP